MGQYFDAKAAGVNAGVDAGNARVQAVLSEARGWQERNAAYSRAYALERDGESVLTVAGENMLRMERNKDLALEALRNRQAGSGFAYSGSKAKAESSLAAVLDMAINDQMRSTATQDSSARVQAAMLRKDGDLALSVGRVESGFSLARADARDSVARAYSKAAPWAGVGQGLLTGASVMSKTSFMQ